MSQKLLLKFDEEFDIIFSNKGVVGTEKCGICLGLQRYGYGKLARSIMTETMREQEKWYLECGTFFEFYDDRKEAAPRELERKGKAPGGVFHPFHQVFHDFGWSGTLYLEMINRAEWN